MLTYIRSHYLLTCSPESLRSCTICNDGNTNGLMILTYDYPSETPHGPSVSPWLGTSRFLRFSTWIDLCPSYSIHERSAREKISADQVAHVLNDEVSRKYIQSLKRFAIPKHSSFPHADTFLDSSPFHKLSTHQTMSRNSWDDRLASFLLVYCDFPGYAMYVYYTLRLSR